MLYELQTEKALIIDRCYQKYSLNSCLVWAQCHSCVFTQLTLHAPREQYLLLSVNFKASFRALCGVCKSWEV